jgi:protein gp37
MEPLLGSVDLSAHISKLGWVIAGGESGANYRHADPDWFRNIRDQCAASNVPFLFKQWEGRNQSEIKAKGRALDGVVHDGYPM